MPTENPPPVAQVGWQRVGAVPEPGGGVTVTYEAVERDAGGALRTIGPGMVWTLPAAMIDAVADHLGMRFEDPSQRFAFAASIPPELLVSTFRKQG